VRANPTPLSLSSLRALWLVALVAIAAMGVEFARELLVGEYSIVLQKVLRGGDIMMPNMRTDAIWFDPAPRPSVKYLVIGTFFALAAWLVGRAAQRWMRRGTPVWRATASATITETYRSVLPSIDDRAARRAERTAMRAFATRLSIALSVASALVLAAFARLPRAPWLPGVEQNPNVALTGRACVLFEGTASAVVALLLVAVVWPSRRRVLDSV
jgi:hypothetical protein